MYAIGRHSMERCIVRFLHCCHLTPPSVPSRLGPTEVETMTRKSRTMQRPHEAFLPLSPICSSLLSARSMTWRPTNRHDKSGWLAGAHHITSRVCMCVCGSCLLPCRWMARRLPLFIDTEANSVPPTVMREKSAHRAVVDGAHRE